MAGENHEHCNDAQQFYAGITPPQFEIRVGGTALWEATVSEPIIIFPLRFLLSFPIPPIIPVRKDQVMKLVYGHRQARRPHRRRIRTSPNFLRSVNDAIDVKRIASKRHTESKAHNKHDAFLSSSV